MLQMNDYILLCFIFRFHISTFVYRWGWEDGYSKGWGTVICRAGDLSYSYFGFWLVLFQWGLGF